jgi:hypothetical protein
MPMTSENLVRHPYFYRPTRTILQSDTLVIDQPITVPHCPALNFYHTHCHLVSFCEDMLPFLFRSLQPSSEGILTLATLLVPVPFSLQATEYGEIPLGSRKASTHYCWGGGPCLSHTNTQSHWSSGSTICFQPRGAAASPSFANPLPP